ncbi:hypothetical protein Tco_0612581 [Tanacetum coccineum]
MVSALSSNVFSPSATRSRSVVVIAIPVCITCCQRNSDTLVNHCLKLGILTDVVVVAVGAGVVVMSVDALWLPPLAALAVQDLQRVPAVPVGRQPVLVVRQPVPVVLPPVLVAWSPVPVMTASLSMSV